MPNSLRHRVQQALSLTRSRNVWASRIAIQPSGRAGRFIQDIDNALDDGTIQDGEYGRLLDTDLIIRGRRGDRTVYVAVEASGVINDVDINRARDSAAILRRLYDAEAVPDVYGYSISGPQMRLERADEEAAREEALVFLEESD